MHIDPITILSGVQVLLLGALSFFVRRYLAEQDQFRKDTTAQVRNIQGNYLSRFDKVNENLHRLELIIKDEFNKIKP